MSKIIDQIFDTFRQKGHLSYGEEVTQLEQALQTAYFAEKDGAPAPLVTAAVLHDYGHLIDNLDADSAEQGLDGLHEKIKATLLFLGNHKI